ncbi:MAG: DUF2782 domain-containing protein [Gammaproteobacteria bacterium]|nr:DUF2782 domain-containing protein [Gammaproteobacteria bacterium]
MNKLLLTLILLVPSLSAAQTAIEPSPDPAPPPSIGVDDDMQPEVSIIKRDDAVVEEYRMNGELYMVKVTPSIGPAYYLIDSTGDGDLNARRNELDPAFVVPSWMIFRW